MSAETRGQAAYEAYTGHANVNWKAPYFDRYGRWADLPTADKAAWEAFAAECEEGETGSAEVEAAYNALADAQDWKAKYGDRYARWANVPAALQTAFTAAADAAITADAADDPVVESITPDTGDVLGGTAVTIAGSGFTGATSVTIGGEECTNVEVVDDTEIAADSPALIAGTYDVVVTTPNGSGTLEDAFTTEVI